jgi:hypothetical protein
MFETLEEKIKLDEAKEPPKERLTRWTIIAVVATILIFGGLYIGLHFFQTVE